MLAGTLKGLAFTLSKYHAMAKFQALTEFNGFAVVQIHPLSNEDNFKIVRIENGKIAHEYATGGLVDTFVKFTNEFVDRPLSFPSPSDDYKDSNQLNLF